MLIDTHCHYNYDVFEPDLAEAIEVIEDVMNVIAAEQRLSSVYQ